MLSITQVRVTSLEQPSVAKLNGHKQDQRSMKTAINSFYQFGLICYQTPKFWPIFIKEITSKNSAIEIFQL